MTLFKALSLRYQLLIIGLLFSYAPSLFAVDVKELVAKMDRLYRASTSQTDMELTIVTPHWQRTLTLKAWSEGMDKTLIRIESPKKDRGIATLRVEDQMWNYFPKVNKVFKVPPSMMAGSWMGSDFTNDDLVRETSLADDYDLKLLPSDQDVYQVELTAKESAAIVWARLVLWVDRKSLYPRRFEYYGDDGRLARTIAFKELKKFGSKTIPSLMVVTPTQKKGHTTTIRYTSAAFDLPLAKDLFSLRQLRR